jgi:hypothetical protein
MSLRRGALAIAGALVCLLVLGVGVSVASSSAKKPAKACTASQATKTNGCTRAWVTAGCKQFVPLVKSVYGVSVTAAPSKVPGRKGVGSLLCAFQPAGAGADESFEFWFFNGAHQTNWAQFKANMDETGHVTGCVPTATSDPATATARATAQPIAGLGSEAIAVDICPGGGYSVWSGNSVASGPSAPAVIDQLAYTQRRVNGTPTGPASSTAKDVAFMRQLVKRYP